MAAIQRERAGDGIEILRLARPEVRNALDSASIAELLAGLADAAADPELRVLVLSTSSARAFCAGADVGETLDPQGGVERMEAFARLYSALDAFPAPVVCVCVGNVVGAGAELAAGSDLRVGGDNLKLAWAGSRLGVPVGPARLAPLIGASRAKDLIYTGRVVGMEEAREIGFLHRTAPAERAEAVAVELAGQIAAHPPEGLRRLKGMFRDFDETHARIAAENDLLVAFQREGAGLPQGPAQRLSLLGAWARDVVGGVSEGCPPGGGQPTPAGVHPSLSGPWRWRSRRVAAVGRPSVGRERPVRWTRTARAAAGSDGRQLRGAVAGAAPRSGAGGGRSATSAGAPRVTPPALQIRLRPAIG